jgi:hypothetical protein
MDNRFLLVAEVAEKAGVTRQRAHQWIVSGLLPATRRSRFWTVEPCDLAAFLLKRSEKASRSAVEPSKPGGEPVPRPESGATTKRLTIDVDAELHWRFKCAAFRQAREMRAVMTELIQKWVDENGQDLVRAS